MPSRQFNSIPPTPHAPPPPLSTGATISISASFSLFLLLTLCFKKLHRKKKTVPSPSDAGSAPVRFSFSSLRRATSSFSPSLRLGQGGFGSVYRATLNQNPRSKSSSVVSVAVKVMDSGSLQGEREFHNELYFSSKIDSKYVVSVMGYSVEKRRSLMIVYELMGNGSLQDCLFHRKPEELKDWRKRFGVCFDIAKGLEYLHHCCDPVVIHGDIKPSNVLLDGEFRAKISDFGLARVKSEEAGIEVKIEDGVVEQSPKSVLRIGGSPDTLNGVELSPEGGVVSPRGVAEMVSPLEGLDKLSVSEGNFDGFSVESGREKSKKKKRSGIGKDWWWKQDSGGGEGGPKKDYVMEWLGNEIKKERPKSDFAGSSLNTGSVVKSEKKKKKPRRKLEWWVSMDDEKKSKKEKRRPAREWWKEEYCEELAREKKKKMKQLKGYMNDDHYSDNWWPRDESHGNRRKRSRSRGSMDWWLEGVSGELWRRRTSHDSVSGDLHKSGGMSSTPSMRGTVCYVAPEYGGGGDLSEKCDVYSYGVLLLVLIAGRRPLQVTGSPMSEFQRANLLSWTRHLARRGKLLELVDQSIISLDKEQALLCITVALHCLQKSPSSRPSMRELVKYLSGESEPPQLPLEFSPSPASRVSGKSHRKARNMAL